MHLRQSVRILDKWHETSFAVWTRQHPYLGRQVIVLPMLFVVFLCELGFLYASKGWAIVLFVFGIAAIISCIILLESALEGGNHAKKR
jgi:hypothetical protein